MTLLKASSERKTKDAILKVVVTETLDSCFNNSVYNIGDKIEVVKSHGIIGMYIRYFDGRQDWIPKENIKILK